MLLAMYLKSDIDTTGIIAPRITFAMFSHEPEAKLNSIYSTKLENNAE